MQQAMQQSVYDYSPSRACREFSFLRNKDGRPLHRVAENHPSFEQEGRVILTRQEATKGYRRFCIFQDLGSALSEISMTPPEHRHWYWRNEWGRPCALFADVDMDASGFHNDLERQKEMARMLMETAGEVYLRTYGRVLFDPTGSTEPLLVLTATTDAKLSLHIHMPEVLFPDLDEQKGFWKAVAACASESEALRERLFWRKGAEMADCFVVDFRVYRSGDFRLPFQRKYGKDNPLQPLLVRGIEESEAALLRAACPTALAASDDAIILPRVLSRMHTERATSSGQRSKGNRLCLAEGTTAPLNELLWNLLPSPRIVVTDVASPAKEGGWFFSATIPDGLCCPVCKRLHSKGNGKLRLLVRCSWRTPFRLHLGCWKGDGFVPLLVRRLDDPEGDQIVSGMMCEVLDSLGASHLKTLLSPSHCCTEEEEEGPSARYVEVDERLFFDEACSEDLEGGAEERVLKRLGLEGDPNVEVRVMNERHIPPLQVAPDTRILLIRSDCSTGKSDAICRFVSERHREEGERWRGLLVTSNTESLAQAAHQRYSCSGYHGRMPGDPDPRDVGVHFYQELDRTGLRSAQSLAVTHNSQWKIDPCRNYQGLGRRFSVYLKDELESTLAYLAEADTFPTDLQRGRRMALVMDRWFVSTSGIVIGLDKDLSRLSAGYLRRILPSAKMEIIANLHRANERHLWATIRRHPTFYLDAEWKTHAESACQAISTGKRVYMVFTSKTELEYIEVLLRNRFPDKKMLFASSDSSPKDRLSWGDVNTFWAAHHVVAITPTITTGVDYNPEESSAWFDCCFAFARDTSVTARTLCQMIMRVRRLSTGKVFALLPRIGYPCRRRPESVELLRRVSFDAVERELSRLDARGAELSVVLDPLTGQLLYDMNDDLTWLHVNVQAERARSQNDFTGEFLQCWLFSGGKASVKVNYTTTGCESFAEDGGMGCDEEERDEEIEGEEDARSERPRDKEKAKEKEAESGGKRKGAPEMAATSSKKRSKQGLDITTSELKQIGAQLEVERRRSILEAPDLTSEELAAIPRANRDERIRNAQLKLAFKEFFGQSDVEVVADVFGHYHDDKPAVGSGQPPFFLRNCRILNAGRTKGCHGKWKVAAPPLLQL